MNQFPCTLAMLAKNVIPLRTVLQWLNLDQMWTNRVSTGAKIVMGEELVGCHGPTVESAPGRAPS